jgi:hypothetical protein
MGIWPYFPSDAASGEAGISFGRSVKLEEDCAREAEGTNPIKSNITGISLQKRIEALMSVKGFKQYSNSDKRKNI